MSSTAVLAQLKSQMVSFLDDLICNYPDQPDFVIFRIFVQEQLPIRDIMLYIIEKLLPLQEMVKTRDEAFFLNYNPLGEKFNESAGSSKVNHFKDLWLSDRVSIHDKNTIWSWFDIFLLLARKYKKMEEENKE